MGQGNLIRKYDKIIHRYFALKMILRVVCCQVRQYALKHKIKFYLSSCNTISFYVDKPMSLWCDI